MPDVTEQADSFYTAYDLSAARRQAPPSGPAAHQAEALGRLDEWYGSHHPSPSGGILVLPTGGGKTFTAGHFLCRHPLSDGFKVLWLAHTHHLLEQAFFGFEKVVGLIGEPRQRLDVRVVSGTIGHFPVHSIRPADDVVIMSIQTACNAVKRSHVRMKEFLDSANGKLVVVFDEAHHSPAPSYRNLLLALREHAPKMQLLGLTATPTHGEERKRGWLLRLFPQGILYQAEPQELMAAGILARPILEEAPTEFEPTFTDGEYQQWIRTNRDLPEDIIDGLANSRERNDYIVGCYVRSKEKYGKTIIFADRWPQCEYISEMLKVRGVRAGAIFSHVEADPGSAAERNRRTAAENAGVLKAFRANDLDVLVNIRMATEGTDVPDVQTVFLTRQTTSQILLTQMVGRALRGPKFGGTEKAYVVSFIDNWKQRINWAAFDQLALAPVDHSVPEYAKRPPLRLVSIEMVRRLARQLDSGCNINPEPYKTYLPIGWYRVEYQARVQGTDDIEQVRRLVMVFENERPAFDEFITFATREDLAPFQSEDGGLDDVRTTLSAWRRRFFGDTADRVGSGLIDDLFAIARHLARPESDRPTFFPFEAREAHDLDALAKRFFDEDFGIRRLDSALRGEYAREDRYWRILYYTYEHFRSHFDGCMNRVTEGVRGGPVSHADVPPAVIDKQRPPPREVSDDVKRKVKQRDGNRCLCCGDDWPRNLRVDHISSNYATGDHNLQNLQTLCVRCNTAKGIDQVDFRETVTPLASAPPQLRIPAIPEGKDAGDVEEWEMFVRRAVNLFYRCSAVAALTGCEKLAESARWHVKLRPGNDPAWLRPHLPELLNRMRIGREKDGFAPGPAVLDVIN